MYHLKVIHVLNIDFPSNVDFREHRGIWMESRMLVCLWDFKKHVTWWFRSWHCAWCDFWKLINHTLEMWNGHTDILTYSPYSDEEMSKTHKYILCFIWMVFWYFFCFFWHQFKLLSMLWLLWLILMPRGYLIYSINEL